MQAWSSRLCPYPSWVKKMKTYMELKDQVVNLPCSNPTYPDRPNTHSPQKSQAHSRVKTKELKRKRRNHQTGRMQYKVRLIERPLLLSNIAMPLRAEAAVTTVTTTPPAITNLMTTSTTRPTANPITVLSLVSKLPSARSQETPNPLLPKSWPKPHGRASKHLYASFGGENHDKIRPPDI